MYFLSRNNTLYHSIVHTQRRRRYLFTTVVILLLIGSTYVLHYCIDVSSVAYEQELHMLRQKSVQEKKVMQCNVQLTDSVRQLKRDLCVHATEKKEEDVFQNALIFVLERAQKSDLVIHSYALQKTSDKVWRTKETVHVVVAGTQEKILHFLHEMQQSHKMITLSDWSLIRNDTQEYTLAVNFSFICINKEKSLQL